jgi:acyl-CoA hydrolase
MTPEMANFVGNVHGGQVLLICDNIAYACASRFAGNVSVTAAIDRVDFLEPVHVGDLLHVVARVTYAGRTSMDVAVDVWSENFISGVTRHTTAATFTFVALKDGKPTPVPQLVPRTHADKVRWLQAKRRRELAAQYREDVKSLASHYNASDEADLDALIQAELQGRGTG